MGDGMPGLFEAAALYLQPFHDLFLATALSSLRVYAAFAVLPALGEQFVQGYVRAGLVFVIAVFVAFGVPADVASHLTPAQWAGFALKEGAIGLLMGFATATVFWTAESVGALIDTQAGYNNVQMTNPLSGEQSTPVSNLLLQMVVAVFYVLGGMLVFIGALFDSYRLWPLFSALPELSRLSDAFAIQQITTLMNGVVKFASPVLLVLLLVDLGVGLMTRAGEKLETTQLAQPIKGAMTMLMLALLMGVMMTQVKHLLLPRDLLSKVQATLGMPSP